jgi:hypothetical protein
LSVFFPLPTCLTPRGKYDAKFSTSGLESGRLSCDVKISAKEKEPVFNADGNFLSPRNLQACLSGGTLKAGVGYAIAMPSSFISRLAQRG